MADPRPIAKNVPADDRAVFLRALGFERDHRWLPPPDLDGATAYAVAFAAPWRSAFTSALLPFVSERGATVPTWAIVLAALFFEEASDRGFAVPLIADALAWCAAADDPAQRAASLMTVDVLGSGGEPEIRAYMRGTP